MFFVLQTGGNDWPKGSNFLYLSIPTSLPAMVTGTMSPYPTVVIVMAAHQNVLGIEVNYINNILMAMVLLLFTNVPLLTYLIWVLKLFCRARFTLCYNVRNTLAASRNLSNYYLTLAMDCGRFTHIMAFHM